MERLRDLSAEALEILERYSNLVPVSKIQQPTWSRNLKATRAYFEPLIPTPDIQQEYGIASRQRVNQIVKHTFRLVYSCIPDEEKEHYDELESYMSIRSKKNLEDRFNSSRSHGGRLSIIASLLAQGADFEDLIKAGFSNNQLSQTRKSIPVPYSESDSERFFQALREHPSDQQISDLLSSMNLNTAFDYQRRHNLGELFVMSDLLASLDLSINHRSIPTIAKILKAIGVPIGTINHVSKKVIIGRRWVLSGWHLGEASEIIQQLQQEGLANEKPVKQLFGPKRSVTSHDLIGGREFQSLGSVLQELGLSKINWSRQFDVKLLEDSGVEVFKCGASSYYIPSEQAESLKKYLAKKLGDLK